MSAESTEHTRQIGHELQVQAAWLSMYGQRLERGEPMTLREGWAVLGYSMAMSLLIKTVKRVYGIK